MLKAYGMTTCCTYPDIAEMMILIFDALGLPGMCILGNKQKKAGCGSYVVSIRIWS